MITTPSIHQPPAVTGGGTHVPMARRGSRQLLLAAALYVGAWVTGLTVAPPAPGPFASPSGVHGFFLAHGHAALVQSALVHGLAATALMAFVIALARTLPGRYGGWVRTLGLSAAAVSLLQFAVMALLAAQVGPGTVGRTAGLFHAVNSADTVKLLLLGGLVGIATIGARRLGRGRWPSLLSAVVAVLLPISGLAFLVRSDLLYATLYVSLPLLLTWIAATAFAGTRRR